MGNIKLYKYWKKFVPAPLGGAKSAEPHTLCVCGVPPPAGKIKSGMNSEREN